MKNVSVSFIIPYYKVEISLLERALDSIMKLDENADWEVWVIDDGTPDRKAREYVLSLGHPRIHYHLQHNSGPGGARNTGMKLAGKEYIQFVDADDYLFTGNLIQVLDMLGEERPDLLAFGFRKVRNNGMKSLRVSDISDHVLFRGDGVQFMLTHNLHGSVWSYIFKKSMAGNLRFTPVAYHEDEEFTALLFLRMQHIITTDLPVYAYYLRENSIMHHKGREVLEKRFFDLLHVIERLQAKCVKLEGRTARALSKRIDMLCMSMVYSLLADSPDSVFLTVLLQRMRQVHLYPLPSRRYSVVYSLVRRFTLTIPRAVASGKVFRLLRLGHIGRAS